MFDVIKQSIFAGLGLASLARDKAEELAAEISRRAKLSEKDAGEFVEEFMRRRDAAQRDLETEIDQRIDHAFIQLGIVKSGIRKVSEEGSREFKVFIDTQIDDALRRSGIASSEDVQSLMARVARLEHQLASGPPR
jgi:polyhydroxyalkanoate synthesis regulator phasin